MDYMSKHSSGGVHNVGPGSKLHVEKENLNWLKRRVAVDKSQN